MDTTIFNKENMDNLKEVCSKIIKLTEESIDGQLMFSQAQCLGERINDFVNNPIVKKSGIIPTKQHF